MVKLTFYSLSLAIGITTTFAQNDILAETFNNTLSNTELGLAAITTTNRTEFNACQTIQKIINNASSSFDVVFLPFTPNSHHYMTTSSQPSACIYTPKTPQDLATAMKILGQGRIRFAISCSGHASNQGFSSTPGVHISLKNFQDVVVSPDNAYVDIGGGISWADVYKKLDSSTVNVVGGRVPGPGIGGFITGGGGFSWLTNQYGLTGDTLISVDMVLPNGTLTRASEGVNEELFWAVKGGGNSFGVVYNFRLLAVPRPPKIYADTKFITHMSTAEFTAAIANFSASNHDPKAQIIPTINSLLGGAIPTNILLAYYDGIPSYDPFSMFNVGSLKEQSFNDFVQSLGVSNLQANQRGAFNTLSLQAFTPGVMDQIANQTKFWGGQSLLHSGTFISFDVEPFLAYSQFAKSAAWEHGDNALPLFLFFSWENVKEDEFWREAMLESCRVIAETAKGEGQDVDGLLLYPNYAMKMGNRVERLFGGNLGRIEEVRRRIDPDDVMLLTEYFRF
ncbi:related to 6-hydroxy-D-nicotine oxidase [Ramularia collo-cygni]|uniref:Related to 6-hydroxy-D-nicotine oxidase n=1 Tax=Ramularia collo-cygni TaxID=112498 RepID=A0A2D3V768_9PEZI|nr:related to 6-hydroxy-D-nicotine oxidase [Ramularia collo-cygni]CZT19406.1 related to 6-hydroxy-D-nicotine oxidase [Ramularia collo-cygni]